MKKQKVQWQKLKWNFSFYDLWFVLSKSFNGIMFRLLGESLIAKVCLGNFDIAFVFTRLLEEQWHIVLIWSIAAPKKQSLTLASDSNHVKYVHTAHTSKLLHWFLISILVTSEHFAISQWGYFSIKERTSFPVCCSSE